MNILQKLSILFLFFILGACQLQPQAWNPPIKTDFLQQQTDNQKLQSIQKIDLKGWVGPEDIVMDSLGNIYCGVHKSEKDFSTGCILKIDTQGHVEEYYQANSWVAGIHFDKEGNLIALSHQEGLIQISPTKQVTYLAKSDENNQAFLIPNGLDIASNGMIYFSNTSSQMPYTIKNGRKLILEMKADGGLYVYNPTTKKVKTLLQGTYFGNGVVLSQKEDFLLIVETTKYRVLRYWLKGPKKGTIDVFLDNLPGFPNGISIREDGSFWLGFTTLRNDLLDQIHPKIGVKKVVYALPEFLQPKQEKFGMVLNISPTGKIIETLLDSTGAFVPEAGAVKEDKGYLFLGGDIVPYISKYKL